MIAHHPTLPWFVRRLWVSDKARDTWEPVLTEFAECWRQLEWLSVVEQVRPCATFFVSQKELAAVASLLKDYGLRATTLSAVVCDLPGGKQKGLRYRAAVGRRRDLPEFSWAWKQGDDRAIGRFLGYPECCCAAFAGAAQATAADDIWRMASTTAQAAPGMHDVQLALTPETNVLWRSVGLMLTPHVPCRFDCMDSIALARKFVECGRHAGYGSLMDRVIEMLSWPAEWNALNGIAEIRTPVVKLCLPTPPRYEKLTVMLRSDKYPELGAHALQTRLTGSARKPPSRAPASTPLAPASR
jgi:hypothetical protein